MFSSKKTGRYAAKITAFDLNRVMGSATLQYVDHLKQIGQYELGMDICEVQDHAATESVKYPHYSLEIKPVSLLNFTLNFLSSRSVQTEGSYSNLVVNKASLKAAKLTSKDEGEFLFTLNKSLRQAVPSELSSMAMRK